MKIILVLLTVLLGASAQASNYPTDYCHQDVVVQHQGPLMVANVESGCGSRVIFGYKKLGALTASQPSKIDLIIKGICDKNESQYQKQTVIALGAEWHGTGYMSASTNPHSFMPDACSIGGTNNISYRYEIAFSDGQGNWDSHGGANYHVKSLFGDIGSRRYKTHEAGDDNINMKAWDIIVGEMKK